MALIKVAVPVVVCVVPGEVHLAPLAVDLHGVPGVVIAGDAAVGDAGGIQQLGVDALVAFARALMAGEAAFRAAPIKAVVVFQLVERPVVQPQGLSYSEPEVSCRHWATALFTICVTEGRAGSLTVIQTSVMRR